MKTSCKKCIFAEKDGDGQSGCSFNNRLSIFKERGLAEKVEWDGSPYYIINGLCDACTQEFKKPVTLDEAKQLVADKLAVDNTFLLLMVEPNEKDIEYFVDVGLKQTPAVKLHIVFSNTVPLEFANHICDTYPVKVTKLLLDEDIYQFAVRQPKTQFITLFTPGKIIPEDFNDRLNHLFNVELYRFLTIRPKRGLHGLVMLGHVVRYLPFEQIKTLEKNALEWTEWNQESV